MERESLESRTCWDLGGAWSASVEGHDLGTVTVPSSYPPMGTVTLARTIPLVRSEDLRPFLVFEGIALDGEVWINDHRIGRLIAFSHHEFDLNPWVGEAPLRLCVKLVDLQAKFGNSRGWETYGGIIRPVYVQWRPHNYLEHPRMCVDFSPGPEASIVASIDVVQNQIAGPMVLSVALMDDHDHIVAQTHKNLGERPPSHAIPLTLRVPNVHRWSLDDPYLYRLVWTLDAPERSDTLVRRVGLRELAIRDRRFTLNGTPIFLKGVCRHDLWAEQGYTLTEAQVRQDLSEIKATGFNFVRLVHYPHHPQVLDIADELGLLVTEEPGFWNVRLQDDQLAQAKAVALEVLTRMVLRDRTHASLLAWILGNESWSDAGYLHTASALCRDLDDRAVGFSDLYSPRLGKKVPAKEAYSGWDPDFYDYHPYGEDGNLYRAAPRHLNDKPLIFGEWGGFWMQHDPWLWERLGQQFAEWAAADAEAPSQLAGFAFWQWADMRQYHRGYPGCDEGVLIEGLVTEGRERKPEWHRMRALLKGIDQGHVHAVRARFDRIAPEAVERLRRCRFLALDVDSTVRKVHQDAWSAYAPGYEEWDRVPMASPNRDPWNLVQSQLTLPWLLSPLSSQLDIAVEGQVSAIVLLGLGDLTEGYPVVNQFGEEAARLTLWGSGDWRAPRSLCHGLEVSRQNRLFQGSRIEPLSVNTLHLFDWVADPDWDVRIVRALVWTLDQPRWIHRMTLDLVDGHSAIVFHAFAIKS